MKLIDIIEVFIAGDWGEETYSKETPCAVTCVRGADIIPISEYDFSAIPVRYINQQAYAKKCLQVGDIIIEKSGGSPTQSTGRVSLVSQELLDHAGAVICSNFCTAFRVKKGWNPLYVYYYLQFIYNLGAFFNFEGKTSGIKNLQLDAAFAAIPIEDISESIQNNIVAILQGLERKIAINRQINQNLEEWRSNSTITGLCSLIFQMRRANHTNQAGVKWFGMRSSRERFQKNGKS